jgi:RNA polymerase sigma-70 factor (ECF subfamily)
MSTSAAAEATALPLRPVAGRSGDDDAALVAAARAGSREAVEALFHRHWRRLYRAAYLICRDAAAAEDIAQESFLAALRALDRFDRRRPLGPWLDRIAANRAIDWQRARAVRGEILADEEPASPAVEPPAAARDDLAAALGELPADQRAVIVLRHVLGFTPREIGRALGLPTGTVNSRMRRGLDALAARLGEGEA